MKTLSLAKHLIAFCFSFFLGLAFLSAQVSPNWKYIRPSNTGLGGDYYQCIKVDRCGNKWTGGYLPFWSEGSVTRFNDTTFTCWSNFEGYLPADRVYDLAFDNNDGLWVATNGVGNGIDHGGISHYDGITWTTWTTANSPLPEDDMRGIAIDHNNNVWATFLNVSTGVGGVAKFDGTNWTIYLPGTSGLPTYNVDKINVDAQNNVYIGTNVGLVKFNGTNWTTYTTTNSPISNNIINDIEVDEGTNKIYLATGNAIDIIDGASWSHINASNAPISASGLWAVDAKNGKIIIATLGGTYLTYIFNGTSWISHPENDQTYDARIDNEGNFWTAGIGALMKFNGITWTTYNSKNTGLTGMFNDDIFIDSKNNAWLASNDNGGINRFDCPNWKDYNPYNAGLWAQPVTYTGSASGITEDGFGDIWMVYSGALGAVVQVPGGDVDNTANWKVWDNTNTGGVSMQFLKRAAADHSGNVWFGYEGACSVSKYSHATNSWTNYNLYQLGQITCGAGSGIKSIRVDEDGNVWICGAGGLAKYDQASWTFYSYLNTTLQGMVMDIAFDPLGNKWIATEHGLVKFDNTTWTTYDVSNSGLLNDYVTSVVADSSGVIWSGSYDPLLTSQNPGGLCSFNGTVWTQYSPGNSGLQEKIIDRLAFDTLNNLWIMGATHGVSIFNPVVVNGYHCLDKNPTCFNTVPVSLVYFKGESRLGKNYLNWQAACTPGNVKFEIQRSIDGREFNFLGSIVSDDLRCSQPYDFTDSDPIEGKNYYRIKMIDDGGKISYSNTLVLMSKKSGFEIISFSPNPVTNDIAFLEISSDLQKQLRILVTDNSGKAVFKTNQIVQAGITQTRLDFKALAAGLYFISIYTTDNDKRSLRFLKNSK